MTAKEDRRQEERAPIELKVEYTRLNRFLFDYTRNISRGGTFIQTDAPLAVGTSFVFKLFVPGLPEPLALSGEVRWTKAAGEPAPEGGVPAEAAGMGIRFVYADDEQRLAVERLVQELMLASLGPRISEHLRPRGG